MMRVLLTGGAGFIGSIIARKLLADDHYIRIMDTLNYGFDPIRDIMPNKNLDLFPGDIRKSNDINDALNDVDVVLHLAAIVGDPACAVQADNATETNYLSTLRLAVAAKDKGIKKFIFASTCSVYGANEDLMDETSPKNPQSLYAQTKIYAENGISQFKAEGFEPVILRLSTLYGLSPRLRFDLAVNYLTGKMLNENACMIFGGDQWRPFLHVDDAANAFLFAIDKYDSMKGEAYNVGYNGENYQMKQIGNILEETFPEAEVQYVEEVKDPRSYRVSFDKIESLGFVGNRELIPSILEFKEFLIKNRIDYKAPQYYNYHP
jgi:nucleoside-diphosphate-sugar epimerase